MLLGRLVCKALSFNQDVILTFYTIQRDNLLLGPKQTQTAPRIPRKKARSPRPAQEDVYCLRRVSFPSHPLPLSTPLTPIPKFRGDTAALKSICCAGLYEDFLRRIARRPPASPKLSWTLHKYITFPFAPNFLGARVVADRAALFPTGESLGVRQAVVRIRSKQSITKPTKGQKEDVGEEKQQDCTEYVVIQQMLFKGELQDWKVWGLADETTLQEVERNPAFAPGLSMVDRIQMMQMGQQPGGKQIK